MAYSRKRSGSENRKRGPIIGFRATEDERAQIKAAAQRAGLTVGSYVRSCSLSRPTTRAVRRPPVETAQLAQLLGLLGAVGGTVQALVQKHGGGEGLPAAEIQETLAAFREAAAAILQAMGKRPALARDRGP
jgi:mobilization protein NikA